MSSAYFKDIRRTKRSELKDYQKRQSQLENIKNAYWDLDNNAENLNSNVSFASEFSSTGIRISGGSNSVSSVFGDKDSGSADSDLSNSKSYINTEYRRVSEKISELSREISQLDQKIDEEETKEREEAKKAFLSIFT